MKKKLASNPLTLNLHDICRDSEDVYIITGNWKKLTLTYLAHGELLLCY